MDLIVLTGPAYTRPVYLAIFAKIHVFSIFSALIVILQVDILILEGVVPRGVRMDGGWATTILELYLWLVLCLVCDMS